jgi:hypothetical protein
MTHFPQRFLTQKTGNSCGVGPAVRIGTPPAMAVAENASFSGAFVSRQKTHPRLPLALRCGEGGVLSASPGGGNRGA